MQIEYYNLECVQYFEITGTLILKNVQNSVTFTLLHSKIVLKTFLDISLT